MSCQRVREQGAALVLGALESPEQMALEGHLRGCRRCADEVDELSQVAARVALALPQREPPNALRQRIISEARREIEAGKTAVRGHPDGTGRWPFGRLRAGSVVHRPGAWPSGWSVVRRSWPVLALAAAFASLLWNAGLQSQLNQTQQQLAATADQLERTRANYRTVTGVLASANLEVRELQAGEGAPGALGKLWIDPASGQGMMMARDLPSLPEDQAYQVWLVRGESRVSAGFLRASEGSHYAVLRAPGKLTDYQRLGITREPASGSLGPTGPRVIYGEL